MVTPDSRQTCIHVFFIIIYIANYLCQLPLSPPSQSYDFMSVSLLIVVRTGATAESTVVTQVSGLAATRVFNPELIPRFPTSKKNPVLFKEPTCCERPFQPRSPKDIELIYKTTSHTSNPPHVHISIIFRT